jgi:hypothetical protein
MGRSDYENQSGREYSMIKVKTAINFSYLNVLNIVSVEQGDKGAVRIWSTNGGYTDTIEEFDIVINRIEDMLIRIAGGMNV